MACACRPAGVARSSSVSPGRGGRGVVDGGSHRRVPFGAKDRRQERRERQVGGCESAADEVGLSTEAFPQLGEATAERVGGPRGRRVVDAVLAANQPPHERDEVRQRPRFARRQTRAHRAGERARVRQRVVVDEEARGLAELPVAGRFDRVDVASRVGGTGVELSIVGGERVGVRQNVSGVRQRLLRGDEYRHRPPAGPSHRPQMEPRKVRLFDVWHARVIEGPAGLLAVVAERDGDEACGLHEGNA